MFITYPAEITVVRLATFWNI